MKKAQKNVHNAVKSAMKRRNELVNVLVDMLQKLTGLRVGFFGTMKIKIKTKK